MRRFVSLSALVTASLLLPGVASAVQAPRRPGSLLGASDPGSASGALAAGPGLALLRREVDVRYGAAPRGLDAAWATFVSDTGDTRWKVLWDNDTRRPVRIFGGSIAAPGTAKNPATAEKHARAFLARHAALLLAGHSIDDFELVTNDDDDGLRTLGFQQIVHAGDSRVPLAGGRVNLRYKADRLFVIGAEALPVAPFSAPLWSSDNARAAALAHLAPAQPDAVTTGATLVALPLVRPHGFRVALAWRVAAESKAPASRPDVYIDSRDGAVIATQESLRFLTGSLQYEAPLRGPQEHGLFPAENAQLLIDGTAATTDATGQFTTESSTSVLSCFAASEVIDVTNAAGPEATLEIAPTEGADVVWSLKDDEQGDAQLSAFVHASRAKAAARVIAPTMLFLDKKLQVKVNQEDSDYACNAFWNGISLNFFLSFQQCSNTARVADVVYHEFGHAFHTNSILASVGSVDPALGEGQADYYASILTGDPFLGPGFYDNGDYLREFDTDYRWPEDISWDPHETGLIFAGAMWDLRTILSEDLGPEEGAALTNQLYRGVLKRAPNIPSAFAEALATDDDDGDLGNGTPHVCQILRAFAPHGITPYLTASGLSMVHEPLRVVPGQSEPYQVKVALEHAFPQCAVSGDDIDGIAIEWRNKSTSGTAAMSKSGDVYTGKIPGQVAGGQLRYKLIAEVGKAQSFLPDNPADPEYRVFAGEVTPIYCNDFEQGSDDWTFGESNGKATDFIWGAPHGGGGDPASAFSGQSVIGTTLTTEGKYRSKRQSFATGPTVELGESKHVRLQFMRWLSVEDGYFDQATVLVNGKQVWQNPGTNEHDGSLSHKDLEWRFEDIDISNFTAGGVHSVQVGFQLTSDDAAELGGWNIDDVCIVAWEPPPGDDVGAGGAGGGGGAGGSGADPGLDEPGEGCACRTAPPVHDSGAPWALFGAATALLALVRRRK